MHVMMLAFGERGRAVAMASSMAFSAVVAVLAFANDLAFVGVIAIVFGLANPFQYRALLAAFFPEWAERRARREAEKEELLVRRLRIRGSAGSGMAAGRRPGALAAGRRPEALAAPLSRHSSAGRYAGRSAAAAIRGGP